jgi:hypothetical protein
MVRRVLKVLVFLLFNFFTDRYQDWAGDDITPRTQYVYIHVPVPRT